MDSSWLPSPFSVISRAAETLFKSRIYDVWKTFFSDFYSFSYETCLRPKKCKKVWGLKKGKQACGYTLQEARTKYRKQIYDPWCFCLPTISATWLLGGKVVGHRHIFIQGCNQRIFTSKWWWRSSPPIAFNSFMTVFYNNEFSVVVETMRESIERKVISIWVGEIAIFYSICFSFCLQILTELMLTHTDWLEIMISLIQFVLFVFIDSSNSLDWS